MAVLPIGGSKIAKTPFGFIVQRDTGSCVEASRSTWCITPDLCIGDFDDASREPIAHDHVAAGIGDESLDVDRAHAVRVKIARANGMNGHQQAVEARHG